MSDRREATLRRLGLVPSAGGPGPRRPRRARSAAPRRRDGRGGAAPPAVVVLDAGCGRSSALARHRARIGRFVGVDIHAPAPGALPYLDEFATVDLCANADAFPPATFDVVLSSFTVEHFADPAAAFANLARWLRPGGSLVLTTVNRRHPFVAAYLGMPAGLRRRVQPLVKASAADAHPLVGACNDPAALRGGARAPPASRTSASRRSATSPAPGGGACPTFALGLVGDLLARGHPVAPLDARRHGPATPGPPRDAGAGGGARRLARGPLGGGEPTADAIPPERRRRTILPDRRLLPALPPRRSRSSSARSWSRASSASSTRSCSSSSPTR